MNINFKHQKKKDPFPQKNIYNFKNMIYLEAMKTFGISQIKHPC